MKNYTVTTNHQEIVSWVEKHAGKPALVDSPLHHSQDTAIRINFPGSSDERQLSKARPTKDISWHEFFRLFEEKKLAFIHYPDAVEPTYSYRFIKREHLGELDKTTLTQENFSDPDSFLTLPSRPVDQELRPAGDQFGLDPEQDNETLQHAPSPEIISEQAVSGDTPDPASDDDTTQNAKLLDLDLPDDPQAH